MSDLTYYQFPHNVQTTPLTLRQQLFSLTCDRTDTTAVSEFFGSVNAYVAMIENRGTEDIIASSPKIKPMKGTVIEDTVILDDQEALGEDLLGIGEDNDSNIEEPETGHSNPYWTPILGKSQMLTKDIAGGITEVTEAVLYPEHDRNRVIIMGGNASEALARLSKLEPLMVCDKTILLPNQTLSNINRKYLQSNAKKDRLALVVTYSCFLLLATFQLLTSSSSQAARSLLNASWSISEVNTSSDASA